MWFGVSTGISSIISMSVLTSGWYNLNYHQVIISTRAMCVYKQLKQEQSLIRKKNGISGLDFALHSLARDRHLKKCPSTSYIKQSYKVIWV